MLGVFVRAAKRMHTGQGEAVTKRSLMAYQEFPSVLLPFFSAKR